MMGQSRTGRLYWWRKLCDMQAYVFLPYYSHGQPVVRKVESSCGEHLYKADVEQLVDDMQEEINNLRKDNKVLRDELGTRLARNNKGS